MWDSLIFYVVFKGSIKCSLYFAVSLCQGSATLLACKDCHAWCPVFYCTLYTVVCSFPFMCDLGTSINIHINVYA